MGKIVAMIDPKLGMKFKIKVKTPMIMTKSNLKKDVMIMAVIAVPRLMTVFRDT